LNYVSMKINLLLVLAMLSLSVLGKNGKTTAAEFDKRMQQEFEDQYGKIEDYLVKKHEGLCHACVLDEDPKMSNSTYAVNSPFCTFKFDKEEFNFGEQLEKFTCLN